MDALGVLQRLGSGHLMDDLHQAITQVAEQVVAVEKDGTVTVTFKIAKLPGREAVSIAEQIKLGLPVPKERGALFFVGDGELHTDDPRQLPMEFRLVEDSDTGVRTLVDVETGEIREAQR